MDKSEVLLFFVALVASDAVVLKKHPGENVTLNCQVDGDVSIRAVEWTRADLQTPEYVLYYSDGHSDSTFQHPSFKDRVELVDRELKDGNVSAVLKNIHINDNGTYECRVAVGGSGRNKRAIIKRDPIKTIKLEVTDSGSNNEDIMEGNRNHVGLAAAVCLVCSAVGGSVVVVLVRKHKKHTDNQSEEPAAAVAEGGQLI